MLEGEEGGGRLGGGGGGGDACVALRPLLLPRALDCERVSRTVLERRRDVSYIGS